MKATATEIVKHLIEKLWISWIQRVPYARKYSDLITAQGGRIVLDHLAFRSLNTHTGEQPGGIMAVKHIFEILGYQQAGKYSFPKKWLNAIHMETPVPDLPKIFISQFEVDYIPLWAKQLINAEVKETPYLLSYNGIELLCRLKEEGELTFEAARVLENELISYFRRAWDPPNKDTVLKLNDISQYAAWVMLHGNSVSHFSALVNDQGVSVWPDLESTCNAMINANIPMKDFIEGERGGRLQQSATKAVKEDVEVLGDDGIESINWTYAYFQLTQRGYIDDNGKRKLFEGFLEKHSRHLFGMTQTLDN